MTTRGIVLRHFKIEQDKLLTILTEKNGVITVYASNANRLKKGMASSTELLCFSTFVIFKNKEKYWLNSADSERIFFGIRKNLDKLALASYFAQLSLELSPKETQAGEYLSLMLNTLHFLENDEKDMKMLKALFELRMMTLSGYMPSLVACCECGVYEAETMYFAVNTSRLFCGECIDKCYEEGAVPIGKGVLAAMRHIVFAPDNKLFSFSLSQSGLKSLCEICERYLLYHLDKALPALDFYKSLVQISPAKE